MIRYSELLADQVRQALAGYRPHARSHFLNHYQSDGGWDQCPQEHVAEFCPGLGVGQNPARIVVHICGDESRTEDGKKCQHPKPDDVAKFLPAWFFRASNHREQAHALDLLVSRLVKTD